MSSPTPILADLGILEFLEVDLRPTIVFELSRGPHPSSITSSVAYSNHAFEISKLAKHSALDECSKSISHLLSTRESHEFLSWNRDPKQDHAFRCAGFIWTAVTVYQKWRVVSGAYCGHDRFPRDDLSEPASNGASNATTASSDVGLEGPPSTIDLRAILGVADTASLQHLDFVQNTNWSATSVGPMHTWSSLLLHTVIQLLSQPDPCVLFWGHERIMIYNQPYVALMQKYHPAALGSSAKVHLAEFWPQFEEILLGVEESKCAAKHEVYRVIVDRSERLEEIFCDGTFTPVQNATGDQVYGVLNHVTEVTKQVVAQRQMATLIKMVEYTSSMSSIADLWKHMIASMKSCPDILPFVIIYTVSEDQIVLRRSGNRSDTTPQTDAWFLNGSVGFPDGHPAIIKRLDMDGDIGLAPAFRLAQHMTQALVLRADDHTIARSLFEGCSAPDMSGSFSQMVVSPLMLSSDQASGFLVLGLNPLHPYDAGYKSFVDLLSRQIDNIATSIILMEKEKLQMQQEVVAAEQQRQWLSEQLQQQMKEARDSELRFYNFAQQAPVGVFILGPKGDIKFSNEMFRSQLAIPAGETTDYPWMKNIHPDDLEQVKRAWEENLQGRGHLDFEFRVSRKAEPGQDIGHVTTLNAASFPEVAEDGSMKSITGIIVDITDQRAHQRAAENELATALEAKRAQENFMDMVSHEMRNPLNAMLQCAEEASQTLTTLSARHDATQSEQALVNTVFEAIQTIQWCGKHQTQIIDDVLTISKLDSDLLNLVPARASPKDVVDQVAKIFTSDVRASNVDFSTSVCTKLQSTHYLMDSSRVLQILINLVGNAIKFLAGRPMRRLKLSVESSPDKPHVAGLKYVPSGRQRRQLASQMTWGIGQVTYISFSVIDTGPGLTSEDMDGLFARFRQATPRTHAQYGGSGLGLFISRELAEMHGGEIGLASTFGEGSTFSFYIAARNMPSGDDHDNNGHHTLRSDDRKPPPIPDVDSPLSSPESISILIVEDNLVNQKVLDRQLKRIGFTTHIVNHGQEALDFIRRSSWWHANTSTTTTTTTKKNDETSNTHVHIDIVLCDLEMPVMDGITCVRQIRQWQDERLLRSHIPFVAVTGNARVEQVKTAKDVGFDDVVCKPYSVKDLVPLVQGLVARYCVDLRSS